MLALSRKPWPLLAVASCALLAVGACAPNSTRTPVEPRLASSDAEREDSRYGAMLRMAASTHDAGDPSAAARLYQQAIKLEPARHEAYTLLGETLVEMGANDEAAQTFEEALERDEGNLAAHRGYGRAMLGLKQPEAAIEHYEAVIAAAPGDVQAYNGLGVAHDLAGRHDAAQAAYRQGLEQVPDSMLLRNNLGLSLTLAGDFDQGIRLLETVANEPGARARNRQNLALAYGLKGDLAAAERISRLDLDDEAVQNNLAYFAALAAVDNERRRAAALDVHRPETTDDARDIDSNRRLQALALDGQGLELGLSPTGRWFLNLGQYPNAAQATDAWRQLRTKNTDLLGDLTRLAGVQDGPQPLLVGPLGDAEEAQDVCGSLEARGHRCRPLSL